MEIKTLSEDIFLIKDFLSDQEIDYIFDQFVDKSTEKDWSTPVQHSVTYSFWDNRIMPLRSLNLNKEDFIFLNKIDLKILQSSELILKDNFNLKSGIYNLLRALPGHEMGVHTDDDLPITKWGVVLYLNDDYVGGEIFYPERNLSLKPLKNSLVIHKSTIKHGVKEVISGKRYYVTAFLDEKTL
jgi:2OG-Fe(II) oxygenase superfamily